MHPDEQEGPGFAVAFFWSALFTLVLCAGVYLAVRT